VGRTWVRPTPPLARVVHRLAQPGRHLPGAVRGERRPRQIGAMLLVLVLLAHHSIVDQRVPLQPSLIAGVIPSRRAVVPARECLTTVPRFPGPLPPASARGTGRATPLLAGSLNFLKRLRAASTVAVT
jgi:hypothetical protein